MLDAATPPMHTQHTDPNARKLLVIFNPTAGRRKRKRLERVLNRLETLGCALTLRETTKRGDAEQFAKDATEADFDAVVAAGGDGTINEVVNGMAGKALPLGIVPLGTANVLSHEVGLPRKPEAIADALAYGPIKPINIGLINGRCFVMMAGIGFDAHVVNEVHPPLKKALGKAAYVWETLRALFGYRFGTFNVNIDGKMYECGSAVIANGHYYGGKFVCARDARLEDDRLHVCLFKSPGPFSAARYAIWMAMGRLDKLPDYEVVPGHKIEVAGADGQPIQSDGDIVGELPLSATLTGKPLNLLVPA